MDTAMKKLFIVVLIFTAIISGCGVDDGDTKPSDLDSQGSDLEVIYKTVDGRDYMCLFVYMDGYQAGGPAMWCERLSEGETNGQ